MPASRVKIAADKNLLLFYAFCIKIKQIARQETSIFLLCVFIRALSALKTKGG